jgi:hypothetical protein
MFGLFNNKKEIVSSDFVWKNEFIKYNALIKHLQQSEKSVLIYYFEDTKAEVENYLTTAQMNFSTEANSFATKVWLLNANTLLHKSSIDNRTVFFAEHHPSYLQEKEIKTYLFEKLSVHEVIFYNSFEDKLMQMFGSDRILHLMERMGLKDDEAIQHSLISSSLEKVQQKVDAKISINSITRLRKDWFEINMPAIDKL